MDDTVFGMNDLDGFESFTLADIIQRSLDHDNNFDAPKIHEKKSRRNKDYDSLPMQPSPFKYSNRLAIHGNKKKNRRTIGMNDDILTQHENKLQYFADLQKSLPQLKEELKSITDKKKADRLEEKIARIEDRQEEVEYYSKTASIIEQYHAISKDEDAGHMEMDTSGEITQFIGKYDNVEKQRLSDEYNCLVNNGQINMKRLVVDTQKCEECDGVLTSNESFLVCNNCGCVSQESVTDFQVSYKDILDVSMKTPFAYKRSNRFKDCLATVQAKENTDIPEYVIKAVESEINKEVDPDMDMMDSKRVKYYLRRLSLTNYYEHASRILNRISGIPPLNIAPDTEEQMHRMFNDIQDPFEIVKQDVCASRISFLSYKYVLYKFFELLNMHEHLHHFPLLKSTDKLRTHDRIWKGICEILGWDFYPSI